MKKEDYFKYYIQGSDHYLLPKDIFNELFQEIINWKEESKQLEERIEIMENYFELISDLGYNYDGFNTVENLKSLIDELVKYANLGRVCNTTETIYINGNKQYNILHKEILSKYKEIIGVSNENNMGNTK